MGPLFGHACYECAVLDVCRGRTQICIRQGATSSSGVRHIAPLVPNKNLEGSLLATPASAAFVISKVLTKSNPVIHTCLYVEVAISDLGFVAVLFH